MVTAQELIDEASKEHPVFNWRNVRRALIILTVIAVFLAATLSGALGAEMTQNVTIKSTQVPYNTTYQLNLSLSPNQTIFLNRTDNESRINLTFPANVTLDENQTSVIVLIAGVVNDENITGNETMSAAINITNDLNDVSLMWWLNANIMLVVSQNESLNATVNQSSNVTNNVSVNASPYVQLINNNYVVNVTSNLLPMSGNLSYEIGGLENSTLNITCEQGIITCPNSTTFGNNNKTTFQIGYRIPITMPDGTYVYGVNFTTGNVTRSTNITFVISEPGIEALRYQFSPDCFVLVPGENYSTVKYDCIIAEEDFNIRRLSQYLERMKALQQNQTYCQPVVNQTTEYIVKGDIAATMMDELNTCRSERDKATGDLGTAQEMVGKMGLNLTDMTNKYLANESDALKDAFDFKVRTAKENDLIRQYYNKRFWTWTILQWGFTLLLIGVAIWYANFRKNKWGGF